MPPRRRKAAKDAEEDPAEQEKSRIEIADDTGDNDSLSSEKECDDDPVMKTYDVFISDQLKDHIYLLQYPIRNPQEQYYDDSAPFEARIKPQEGTLELDVPLDTNNFSLIRGEKFAGQSSDSGIKREAKVLDRQRLSGISQPNQANYFVATIRGDQMHLSQVKSTIQLRPSFHYFDALIGGEKRKKAPADDSAARQPRAVQMQVKSADDPRDARGGGLQFPVHEEFIPLQWVDTDHIETLEISDRLLCRDMSRELVSKISTADFLGKMWFKDSGEDTHAF